MSGPIHAVLLLLLASATSLSGCADPNPTFVFDAAPAVKPPTTGGAGNQGGSAGNGGNAGNDAGADAAGGSP